MLSTACGRASNAEGGPARAAAPAPATKARAVRTRPRTGSRRLVTGGPSAGGRAGIGAGEVGYADGRLVAVPQVTPGDGQAEAAPRARGRDRLHGLASGGDLGGPARGRDRAG